MAENKSPERDRIAEAYFGRVFTKQSTEIIRRRVDWMVEVTTGSDVLDIGCSEGILAILLARQGRAVVGVDVNPEALQAANGLLESEQDQVRSRVNFTCKDLAVESLEKTFDTVHLGEVIEHLHDPTQLLTAAAAHLRPDGRIVVTTPFGYFPHDDHYQTFGFEDFIDLFRNDYIPESLGVRDYYICFHGKKTNDKKAIDDEWARFDQSSLLRMTQNAMVSIQKLLYERLKMESQRKMRESERRIKGERKIEKYRLDREKLLSKLQRIESMNTRFKSEIRQLRSDRRDQISSARAKTTE